MYGSIFLKNTQHKLENSTKNNDESILKEEKKSIWKIIRTPLTVIITILIFVYIFTQIDIKKLIDTLVKANFFFLFLAFLLIIPMPIISALRFQTTLKAIGYKIRLMDCFQIIMGVLPLTSITPAKSSDFLKCYYLRGRVPISKTTGGVLTERIFDVLILTILCIIGLIFFMKLEILIIALIILGGVFGFFIFSQLKIKLPIPKKWNRIFQNLFLSIKTLFKQRKYLSLVVSNTLLLWLITIVQTFFFFTALGLSEVPILYIFANVPIAIFIGQIPFTPGGMGFREGGFILLFSEYDPEGVALLGVGLLYTLVRYWTLSIAGLPFMQKLLRKK